jgi:Ca-activated chloride channel family protein
VIEEVQTKGTIDRTALFSRLDSITPRGGTDFGIALSKAISLLSASRNKDRNQRIILLTDANPTAGASIEEIRAMSEDAFTASNRRLGVTYCGIGLSFDAASCAKLTQAHGTTVSSISNSAELKQVLMAEFNYLVSPVAFDVRVGFSSSDYSISAVFGGDEDCLRRDSFLEFRTMTASAVGAEGVKGSVLIIHLKPSGSPIVGRSSVRFTIDLTPAGKQSPEHQEHEYFLNSEPIPLTEKAFALSVYYRTLREMLPQPNVRKEFFTVDESATLIKLKEFLQSRPEEIRVSLCNEIKMVDQLIANHCEGQRPPEVAVALQLHGI